MVHYLPSLVNREPSHEVYLSITNPAETTAPLQRVYVECKGNNGGTITAVRVHFANCLAFSREIEGGDEDFNTWGDGSVFDKAYGINVTLVVDLPAQESSLELYSTIKRKGLIAPGIASPYQLVVYALAPKRYIIVLTRVGY
ncbi:hypothetical protein TrVFT333_006868 [Trichoderma virens FT-333]|nr:hypothetical protein TrVFT333_006868 [Trichoderma virens FT-333]